MGRPRKTAVSKNKTVRRRSETRNISNARSRLDIESIKGFKNVDLVGSKISRPVGKVGEIDNAVAYLLKKPVEFFNEDYAKLAASITAQEQAITRPNDLANQTGEIKIR